MLHHKQIATLPKGVYPDGNGLRLIKSSETAARWEVRYSLNKSRRSVGLGAWPDVSVKRARELASKARHDALSGIIRHGAAKPPARV